MENILLIDDDLLVLDSTRNYLQHLGYEVTTACSGLEGITFIENGYEYDLVITDIRMPEMSGNELAKILRKSDCPYVPIIAISGFHDDVEEELFDCILQKPFKLKILLKTIKALINKIERLSIPKETNKQNGSSRWSMT